MKKVIILQAVAALALASCAQTEETRILPESEGMFEESVKELSATIPDFEMDDDTKTTISDRGAFSWEMNDELGLWPVTSTGGQAMFYVSNMTDNHSANFTANGFGVLRGETYSALYPFDDSFTRTGAVLKYDDQLQTGNNTTAHLGSHDYLAATMTLDAGSTATGKMSFSHLGCITKFTIDASDATCEGKTFTKLTLKSASSTPFVTSANYNPISQEYTTTTASSIDIDLGDGFTRNSENKVVIYAMMSPSNWLGTDNLTATLTDTEDEIYSGKFSGKNMAAGKGIGYSLTVKGTPKYIDLTESGETANCYIVSGPGRYRFKTTQGNSSTAVDATNCGVLWETFNTNVIPTVGDLICDVSYVVEGGVGYIYFTAKENKGNAVIAAYNNSNKAYNDVRWSWHIWLVNTPQAVQYANITLMDRNLGAIDNDPNNNTSIGLCYQWGRKDPFLSAYGFNAQTGDGVTLVRSTSVGGYNRVPNDATGPTTIAEAIKYPTRYIITSNAYNNFWCSTGISNAFWNTNKTIYDPCPPGYKVSDKKATGGTLSVVAAYHGGFISDVNGTNHYWPMAGYRGTINSANINNPGVEGRYWHNSWGTLPQNGYYIGYSTTMLSNGTFVEGNETYAVSSCNVRCQKIQ